jgi:hypothetical protein
MRDFLGVPSCGIVYEDAFYNLETPIPLWNATVGLGHPSLLDHDTEDSRQA